MHTIRFNVIFFKQWHQQQIKDYWQNPNDMRDKSRTVYWRNPKNCFGSKSRTTSKSQLIWEKSQGLPVKAEWNGWETNHGLLAKAKQWHEQNIRDYWQKPNKNQCTLLILKLQESRQGNPLHKQWSTLKKIQFSGWHEWCSHGESIREQS